MTREVKMSDNLSSECFNIGRDIARLRQDQRKHRHTIADCERDIREGNERTREIRRRLNVLRSAQVALEAAPRALGPGPVTAGAVTSRGIGLARQIDESEREREQISTAISACTRRRNNAQGDLSHVESHLERLTESFSRAGCAASTIPF